MDGFAGGADMTPDYLLMSVGDGERIVERHTTAAEAIHRAKQIVAGGRYGVSVYRLELFVRCGEPVIDWPEHAK